MAWLAYNSFTGEIGGELPIFFGFFYLIFSGWLAWMGLRPRASHVRGGGVVVRTATSTERFGPGAVVDVELGPAGTLGLAAWYPTIVDADGERTPLDQFGWYDLLGGEEIAERKARKLRVWLAEEAA